MGKSPTSAIDYDTLVQLTEGYSGADIAGIVKDAKMAAVRDTVRGIRHEEITMAGFGRRRKKNEAFNHQGIIGRMSQIP